MPVGGSDHHHRALLFQSQRRHRFRLGFGEHLFEACRHQLDQRKLKGLIVWALFENTPAIDFYWRRGGRPVAEAREKFGKAELNKIAFVWK